GRGLGRLGVCRRGRCGGRRRLRRGRHGSRGLHRGRSLGLRRRGGRGLRQGRRGIRHGTCGLGELDGNLADRGAINGRLGQRGRLQLLVGGERETAAVAGKSRGGGQHQHGDEDQFAHVKSPLFDGNSL